jgi:xanthine dehydrogenase accessory factor
MPRLDPDTHAFLVRLERRGSRAVARRDGLRDAHRPQKEAAMTPEILAALDNARRSGRPVVLGTRLPDGVQCLLPDSAATAELNEAARAALADDETRTVKVGGRDWFLHVYNPPLRLVVVGAVHIAQALVPFASACGFAVTVVDPRRAFATDERFPNVTVSSEWPDEAMEKLRPDVRTAVVTLTHDPKLDDPALDHALKSPAFYIGALGSRKTHAARLKRLRELGHNDLEMGRIHGPVGLNIEAVTAPEIALSIMAEIVAAHRGSPLGRKQAA